MGKNKHKHEKHKHHRPSREYDEMPLNPAVPKLIVKIGSEMTPERVDSPAAPVLYPSDDQFHHHHRHKEKKKKKKKDKKKNYDKEKDREHRHHHRKKKKREYSSMDPGFYPVKPDTPEIPCKVPRLEEEPGMLSPKREVPSRTCASSVKQKTTMFGKVLEHLLVMLEKKDVSHFFSQPVSDTFAPGYSQIIREPMDFSTMNEKIEDGKYENLDSFRRDFELICNNCMLYNSADTIYHKSAKRLLQQGLRVLAPDRMRALAEHIPMIKELTVSQLGFELKDEIPAEMTIEDEKDVSKVIEEIRGCVRRPPGRFEAIPDNLPPEDVSNQAREAAQQAAAKLARHKPRSQMGFLRQKQDGTTSLAIVTPNMMDGSGGGIATNSATGVAIGGERPVTLGQLIGRVKNGASALQGFKEDRRNCAKAFNPIYYGAFSSYGPAYDSTFANLTKQETELVYSTYGDDVGVAYAESIKNFSKNCEYATFIVDHLLDILTGSEHKKTTKFIEEEKSVRLEESAISAAFGGGGDVKKCNSTTASSSSSAAGVDFEALKSLAGEGIDMSFLDSLQSQYSSSQANTRVKLERNAALLDTLREVQHDRLSGPPPNHLGQISGPSEEECELAERVQSNLVSMVGQTRPKDIFIHNGRT